MCFAWFALYLSPLHFFFFFLLIYQQTCEIFQMPEMTTNFGADIAFECFYSSLDLVHRFFFPCFSFSFSFGVGILVLVLVLVLVRILIK